MTCPTFLRTSGVPFPNISRFRFAKGQQLPLSDLGSLFVVLAIADRRLEVISRSLDNIQVSTPVQ